MMDLSCVRSGTDSSSNDEEKSLTVGGGSNWPANAQMYNLLDKIGQGAFASVYCAKCKEIDLSRERSCAIKVLDLEHIDTNFVDIRLEVQAMRLSQNPNVLTCYTSFVHETTLWLVTQLMSKGSSLNVLQKARSAGIIEKNCGLDEKYIRFILFEALQGLRYFHDNGQIHRDIKAGNILLDGTGDVRIADFGVSGWLISAGNRRENTKTFVGTPCWMAPEVMEQVDGYDYKADIWSIGITAMELAKGLAPYAKYPPMKVLLLTIQQPPPSLESYNDGDDVNTMWSQSFQNVIKLCLQKDPKKRPSCEQILSNEYFSCLSMKGSREAHRSEMKSGLCDLIEDVGMKPLAESESDSSRFPGTIPITIMDRPAGTTWVFPDGSQVLASSSDNGNVADQNEDFFDEFERETGGENFSSAKAEEEREDAAKAEAEEQRRKEKEENNDLMDAFENATGGENFRKATLL